MSLENFMDNCKTDDTPDQPKKKKQKVDKTVDFEYLRQQAKAMCTCPEEWRLISKYKHNRLKEWITEREFLRDKETQQSITTGAASVFCNMLDWSIKAKGHVADELMQNQGWRTSFDEEVSGWSRLLSNKMRLAVMTSTGVVNGKQAQLKLSPDIDVPEETITIESEINGEILEDPDADVGQDREENNEMQGYEAISEHEEFSPGNNEV